jgi:hypothetical protein
MAVSLRETADFGRLHVETHADLSNLALVANAVAGYAEPDDVDHVWVSVPEVRGLAGSHARQTEWRIAFSTMLEKAKWHGWLSADARHVRAHVVWIPKE